MNRSFRRNLIILILIVVTVLNLMVFIGAKLILSDSFKQLERTASLENVQRAINAVENDLEGLGTLCTDWSVWDDTYNFIADRNPGYLASNLVASTFSELHLNAVLIFDAKGDLVFSRAMDLEKEEEIDMPEEFLTRISRRQEIVGSALKDLRQDGILLVADAPVLISLRPILKSDGEGPARGTFVMIRFFTAKVIAQLSKRTALSLYFKSIPPQQKFEPDTQYDHATVSLEPGDPQVIWGHSLLKDIDGLPVLTLNVKMQRDVYNQGVKTIAYFLKSFLLSSLLIGLALYFLILKSKGEHAESERRFRYVFENTTDGLFVVEPNGKIKLMNQAAKQHLGLQGSVFRWDAINALVENRDFCALIKGGLAGESRGPVDLSLYDLNRKAKQYLRSYVAPLVGPHDSLIGAIVTIHNVTGQKEADLLKSEFIATAAHELNTPLACIMGYSELLLNQKTFDENLCREYLPIIMEKSEALEKIIYDLLHLGKVESGGKIFLEKTTYDLHSSLETLLSSYRKKSQLHRFENNLPTGQVIIVADRHRIDQVFDNLLSNAVKYAPAGGRVRVDGELSDDKWVFSVEDQGVGIPAEHLERIFEKFYRIDNGPTAVGGLGLGLSITKNIIEEHGGRVWVESIPNKETKILFTLS